MNIIRIASSDGVDVPVYDYAPGSTLGSVLFSHATGFHGRCFNSTAALLADSAHCYSFDYRGYGDATLPHDWKVTWSGYGDDAQTVAQHVANQSEPSIAFGHSMGGAALVMAALRKPELFRALVLFEPIIFPPIVREKETQAAQAHFPKVRAEDDPPLPHLTKQLPTTPLNPR